MILFTFHNDNKCEYLKNTEKNVDLFRTRTEKEETKGDINLVVRN